MLEGQSKPLAIASRILKVETLKTVARLPFNLQGWAILDRWALNNPENLLALEAQGLEALKARLLQQQTLESETINRMSDSLGSSMAQHEMLISAEVETELL